MLAESPKPDAGFGSGLGMQPAHSALMPSVTHIPTPPHRTQVPRCMHSSDLNSESAGDYAIKADGSAPKAQLSNCGREPSLFWDAAESASAREA